MSFLKIHSQPCLSLISVYLGAWAKWKWSIPSVWNILKEMRHHCPAFFIVHLLPHSKTKELPYFYLAITSFYQILTSRAYRLPMPADLLSLTTHCLHHSLHHTLQATHFNHQSLSSPQDSSSVDFTSSPSALCCLGLSCQSSTIAPPLKAFSKCTCNPHGGAPFSGWEGDTRALMFLFSCTV